MAVKTLAGAIKLGFDFLIRKKWTASPAIVESYNKTTRRAVVRIVPINDSQIKTLSREYPLLPNVPVVFNGGGGFTVTAPLSRGDAVMLVFARHGISFFKNNFVDDRPSGGFMDMNSAVAIPCFGSINASPSDGLCLQKNDGSVKVEVLDDSVDVSLSEGSSLVVTKDSINANGAIIDLATGDVVSKAGVSLSTHTHSPSTGQPIPSSP